MHVTYVSNTMVAKMISDPNVPEEYREYLLSCVDHDLPYNESQLSLVESNTNFDNVLFSQI